MDEKYFSLLNLLAQWFNAIGTIGAVILALYFASRDRKIKIDIVCEKANYIIQDPYINFDIISIRITNLGYREFIVDHLYWKLPFDKIIYIQEYNPIFIGSNAVPTKLSEGNIANYPIKLSDFEENAKNFICSIKFLPSFLSRFIRIGVYTTTKKKYEVKIGKELRKWILTKK